MSNIITTEVKSVGDVLQNAGLCIPDYQRPYKWERRHIRNLFYDICEAVEKNITEYRIGSIILHKNGNKLDIVDGQQRLISLSLFFYNFDKTDLPIGASNLINEKFVSISRQHAKENLNEWQVLSRSIEKDKLQNVKDFLMNKCRVSIINMPEDKLPEAFQLFDSQNNRGKALEPHDLLKAYHLRAIKNPNENTITKWEMFVNDKSLNLKTLFDKHLFRVRRWANGDTGLFKRKYTNELRFSERFVDDFKGVSLGNKNYPYLGLYKELEKNSIEFPNSLCMPIINGENFFRFIEYAYGLFNNKKIKLDKDDLFSKNRYARNMNLYENMTALFIDRFGENEHSREVHEKIFVWAFYPRVKAKYIYDATIANYSANGTFQKKTGFQRLFQKLSISATPREFIASIDMDILENYTVDKICVALGIIDEMDIDESNYGIINALVKGGAI